MALKIAGILIVAWILVTGWKFYNNIDWEEPADPSPDLAGMRKRQAELMHIQDVMSEAVEAGKLSRAALDEFNRYAESEIAAIQAVETAWRNRPRPSRPA
jgi:hypothetical protein